MTTSACLPRLSSPDGDAAVAASAQTIGKFCFLGATGGRSVRPSASPTNGGRGIVKHPQGDFQTACSTSAIAMRQPPLSCDPAEPLHGHARIDARSLALDALAAHRLRRRPELLRAAKENLRRWRRACHPNVRATLTEWQWVVDAGMDAVLGVLAGEDERSVRLRQSSPFVGEEIISRAERGRLLRRFAPERQNSYPVKPMDRLALEHLIRASGGNADDTHIVIIGSQAILGQFPDAPEELLVSIEADVYPKHKPENAVLIDGAIGERSLFHETYGYYAHGVGEDTAILPEGWQERVIAVCNENTNGYTGECLEAHDLAVSKLAAGREKDMDFVRTLLAHGMVRQETLQERIEQVERGGAERRGLLRQRLLCVLPKQGRRR